MEIQQPRKLPGGSLALMTLALLLLPTASSLAQTASGADRGWLGLYIRDLDPQDIAALDLSRSTQGVVVSGVDDDGPAALAGIEPGDVIARVEGRAVVDRQAFVQALSAHRVGDRIRLSVVRSAVTRQVEFELRQRPREMQGAAAITPGIVEPDLPGAQSTMRNIETFDLLEADLAHYFRVDAGTGVLILKVGQAGLSEYLRAGDVVVACNGVALTSTTALRSLWESHRQEGDIRLGIVRNRRSMEVVIPTVTGLPEALDPAHAVNTRPHRTENWQELRRDIETLQQRLLRLEQQIRAVPQKR